MFSIVNYTSVLFLYCNITIDSFSSNYTTNKLVYWNKPNDLK